MAAGGDARAREERLLAAIAYGIRRQEWGERILDQAYGANVVDEDDDAGDEALAALERIAHRAGFTDFNAREAR